MLSTSSWLWLSWVPLEREGECVCGHNFSHSTPKRVRTHVPLTEIPRLIYLTIPSSNPTLKSRKCSVKGLIYFTWQFTLPSPFFNFFFFSCFLVWGFIQQWFNSIILVCVLGKLTLATCVDGDSLVINSFLYIHIA